MFKYQHIENNFKISAVNGLLNNNAIVQPKLDGSNCQLWIENKEIFVSSRNKLLSHFSDNAGCYKKLYNDNRFIKFFQDYPDIKLVGEWLIPHKIKYLTNAYNEVYIFDAIKINSEDDNGKCIYVPLPDLNLANYNINCVPEIPLKDVTVLNENLFKEPKLKDFLEYLIDKNSESYINDIANCEGMIVKNYTYVNKFGRSQWCKLINHEFYKNNNRPPKSHTTIDNSKELSFIHDNLSNHIFEKCYFKIKDEKEEVSNKDIGIFIKNVINEFQEDVLKICEKNIIDSLNIKSLMKVINVQSYEWWVLNNV